MGRYTDVPCVHCGEPFNDKDEVVVCPICGAPHHRACYDEVGHCANIEAHATGEEWQNPNRQGARDGTQACPKCGASNPPEGIFCQYCGTKLDGSTTEPGYAGSETGQPGYGNPYGQNPTGGAGYGSYTGQEADRQNTPLETVAGPVTPDEVFDGVSAKEIAIFVGPNSRYFLTQFKIMKETGRKFSFNLSSFFFSFCYFAHRKMFTIAAITGILFAALNIPLLIYSQEAVKYTLNLYMNMAIPYSEQVMTDWYTLVRICNIVGFVAQFVVACFANRLYYTHVVKSIKSIKANYAMTIDNRAYYSALARKGRTNRLLGFGLAAATFLIYFAYIYFLTWNYVI